MLGRLLHDGCHVTDAHTVKGSRQLGGVWRIDAPGPSVRDVHPIVHGGEVTTERNIPCLSHQAHPRRLEGASAGVHFERIITQYRQMGGVGTGANARSDDIHDARSPIRGEPIDIRLISALQRGLVAKTLHGAVAQTIHDDDKDLSPIVHRIDGHYER